MNGVRPWRPVPPHSEPPHHTAMSALQASERLATADHLPSGIEMSTD